MFWWGGPGWSWVGGLFSLAFWVALIVVAVVLLRRELPHLGQRSQASSAIRMLEERYARGEISREEFLHRREVLLHGHGTYDDTGAPPRPTPPVNHPSSPGGPPPPPPAPPTEPLPPATPG